MAYNDTNAGEIEWPKGGRTNPAGESWTFVPGQVPALSKAGRDWFKATARNLALYPKKCAVPQSLGELQDAVKAGYKEQRAELDAAFKAGGVALMERAIERLLAEKPGYQRHHFVTETPQGSRPDERCLQRMTELARDDLYGVTPRLRADAIERAAPVVDAMIERCHGRRGGGVNREAHALYLKMETARILVGQAARWFAFDGAGKIVLSLRTNRERSLEIAVAYNKAGGDLVLLAPSRDLASTPTEACVAIP